MLSGILGFGIRNPTTNWNPEFNSHWQRIRNPVLGIQNPWRGIQNFKTALNPLSWGNKFAIGLFQFIVCHLYYINSCYSLFYLGCQRFFIVLKLSELGLMNFHQLFHSIGYKSESRLLGVGVGYSQWHRET